MGATKATHRIPLMAEEMRMMMTYWATILGKPIAVTVQCNAIRTNIAQ